MGTLVGAAAEATALVEELAAGLRRIRALGPSHCRPRVSFEECDEPMIGICWVSELIEIAGGEDVLRRRGRPARSGSSVPKKPPRPHRTSLSGPGNNGGCCSGRDGLQPNFHVSQAAQRIISGAGASSLRNECWNCSASSLAWQGTREQARPLPRRPARERSCKRSRADQHESLLFG